MSAKQAFEYCQAVHDLRTCPVEVGSPQTQSQRQQVVRVIAALIHEHEMRKSALEAAEEERESFRRFHAELQQQVLDQEKAQATAAAGASSATSASSKRGAQPSSSSTSSTTTPVKGGANGARSGTHSGAHSGGQGGGKSGSGSGPPLSPPIAVMKPNVVVRDTTQEHIFSMSKHNPAGIPDCASASGTGSAKGSQPANNNNHFGRKKQNSGTSAITSAGTTGSSSLPSILGNKHAPAGSSVPSSPVRSGNSALQEYNNDSSNMITGSTSTPRKSTPPGSSASPAGSSGGGGEGGGGDSAAALLQTLQAHPPRSPPAHTSPRPRAESLQKLHLHPRGSSSSSSRPSSNSDLHQLGGVEVYIPPSSDEGEDSHTEDDDEGFIAHAVSTMSSVGGKIPLYQQFAPDKLVTTTSATGTGTGATSAEEAADSSSMQVQVSDNEDCDMDTELSATTTGSVRENDAVSYISSTDSRPMSIVQDSPTVSSALAAVDFYGTGRSGGGAGGGGSAMTSTGTTVTGDSLDVGDISTPNGSASASGSTSAMDTTPPRTRAATYSQDLSSHEERDKDRDLLHQQEQESSALDDDGSNGLRAAETTTTSPSTSGSRNNTGATATGNATAGAFAARSSSSDGTSAQQNKPRRLSGTKVLSNAFKAGIKMFTGGGSSSTSSGASSAHTTPKHCNVSTEHVSRSASSDAAAAMPSEKNKMGLHPPGSMVLRDLQTKSNDSAVTYSTSTVDSNSSVNTPTSPKTVPPEEGGLTRHHLPSSVSQRSAHSLAGVEPTPPKGSAPTQRGPLTEGRS